ncbi:aspartyl-phosphate phosphatase Spo0E family protein [Desmospora profundinema]|uniref:Vacuolar-type H+-ATPase subunit I/STV1 n=1 Tax=Desmospora profundinema TaxID=1571184 RepID=A0ABU1IP43_9BACL|nr:aspartyl-phosphate phosphatase Spo0E family protein [Desmospora profundinema]MDR6226297.1 vacuolar-type H+-ATPase subunit I/STV1 [Desmospora profundinema]
MVERQRVEREMERLRSTMEREAAKRGLYHPVVIHISQQLDKLHNEWNRLQKTEEKDVYMMRCYPYEIREAAIGSCMNRPAGHGSGCISCIISV